MNVYEAALDHLVRFSSSDGPDMTLHRERANALRAALEAAQQPADMPLMTDEEISRVWNAGEDSRDPKCNGAEAVLHYARAVETKVRRLLGVVG